MAQPNITITLTPDEQALVKAAPAMLAALEIAERALRAHGLRSTWDAEQVRAAIAMARGDADLREANTGEICTACGRDSLDCSRDPCAAVIADREA